MSNCNYHDIIQDLFLYFKAPFLLKILLELPQSQIMIKHEKLNGLQNKI